MAGTSGRTYLFMGSVASFGDFDKAMGEGEATLEGPDLRRAQRPAEALRRGQPELGHNRYRLDPRQSYVPAETRQKDPAFWMPKAPAPAKAPAKKP